MDALMENPAFTTFAACTAILVAKSLLSGLYTALTRIRQKQFVNPEDAKAFKGTADPAETDAAARALRIQRNDTENLPLFFGLGLVFVLSGATAFEASVYFWTFTVARILHTLTYMGSLQPWRFLSFAVGMLCLLGMAVQVLLAALA
ncbi:MAG: MAPEG family protein [Thermoanaerobaculia bacterium]|nr:MAPEG family protein [Thermoanaerobaculia bacterium]